MISPPQETPICSQNVISIIHLGKMDRRLTILVSSFLRTAGQTRGSPVSQRATEHRNDTPRLPDDNNHQRTPLSTTKTQQHFIRLTCATWKPAFNPRIQRQRCTDQTSSIPDDPLSWQTPASSLAGTRLRPLATAHYVHTDSSIQSDCDCEHRRHTRDTLCPLPVPLANAAPGDIY